MGRGQEVTSSRSGWGSVAGTPGREARMRLAGPRRRGGEGDPGPGSRAGRSYASSRLRSESPSLGCARWEVRRPRCASAPERGLLGDQTVALPLGRTESGSHGKAPGQALRKGLADKSEALREKDTEGCQRVYQWHKSNFCVFQANSFWNSASLNLGVWVLHLTIARESLLAVLIPTGTVIEPESELGHRSCKHFPSPEAPASCSENPLKREAVCQMCRPGPLFSKGSRRIFFQL